MSLPPLRRQVLVAADPESAQRMWTDEIGAWWPIATHGCFGAGARVAFEGDRIVETAPDGERAVWGTVTRREPGVLAFTWHPGRAAEEATGVVVTFTAAGDATLVTLEHSGWQSLAQRSEYSGGWVAVLGLYADAGDPGDARPGDDALWFVLEHRPGPSAPSTGVFGADAFPRHLAFLAALEGEGLLVAAGPLPDDPGAGMTIVRVPDPATGRRIVRAAQVDDGAVASGLLDVRVRPWSVVLSGS